MNKIDKAKLSSTGLVLLAVMITAFPALAQSGGQFAITKSVIAGGGVESSGGQFSLGSTVGQTVAGGPARGGTFGLTSGFWNFTPSSPTAAAVGISGRIQTFDGQGIRNVSLSLIDATTGETRSAISSSFGYYKFENIYVGQTYILTVSAKRFQFEPNTRIITLLDELTDEDFTALP